MIEINKDFDINMQSVFIFCAKDVGGHEHMCLKMIDEAYPNAKIYLPYQNKRLEKLVKSKGISYEFHHAVSEAFQAVQTFLNFFQIYRSIKILKKIKGKNIILVQGDIELGSQFLLSSKLLNIPVSSYIPYAHSFKKMNKKCSFFRDLLSKFFYKWCDNYITISDCFKDDLLTLNANASVDIYYNHVAVPDAVSYERGKGDPINLFLIGRVEFHHKGHDLLMNALLEVKSIPVDINMHFVGDGSDLPKLKTLCEEFSNPNITINFIFHGWLEKVWDVAYCADLVIIPSRFEGVPLVMLEAMKLGKNIIASNRDGMRDYLAPDSLFCFEGSDFSRSLANKLNVFLMDK